MVDSARERDLDHLLMEEFYASPQFREWFIAQVQGFSADNLSEIRATGRTRGLSDSRERDLRLDFLTESKVPFACLLIEDKVTAAFSAGQAESYLTESHQLKKGLGNDKAAAVLVAPEHYTSKAEVDCFDTMVTIEAIRDFFRSRLDESSRDTELSRRLEIKLQFLNRFAPSRSTEETEEYFFKSLGRSAFVEAVREELRRIADLDLWDVGGSSSLTRVFRPTTAAIAELFGEGLKTQIWMERPKSGQARCKFEIAYKVNSLSPSANRELREELADSLRKQIAETQLPSEVELANGSTVVAIRFALPEIQDAHDDNDALVRSYSNEIRKIDTFLRFLESSLECWNDERLSHWNK